MLNNTDSTLNKVALIFGIVYAIAGLLGFMPGLIQPPDPTPVLGVETGYGKLLGLFPVNILHNLVHLAIGAWGIVASRTVSASLQFSRGVAIFYGLLTVLGLIPATNTLFGLVPIYGHDVWLHAVSALVLAYFGFRMANPEHFAKSSH